MARGIFATTLAVACAFGVSLWAFDGQHGDNNQHGNSAAAHAAASSHSTSTPSSSTTTTSKTPTTPSPSTSTNLSPVQLKLQSHTQLASKLQTRLPSSTNVVTAASGFRNLGQFVAAVNVSHNLGIPFTQLKTDMVTKHMSLGQSIQALRPSVNSTKEVDRAQTQTRQMMDADGK
jgi:hypothetical protein